MTDCEPIEHGINVTCDDFNKVGGINQRIFVGSLSEIDEDTITFGANGEITAFSLLSGKKLKLFVSDRFKQAGRHEAIPNENGPTTWNHFVDFKHFYSTQAQKKSIEQLCKGRQTFAILQLNAGKFEVYGIGNTSLGFASFGLKLGSNAGGTGVLLNDDTTDATTIQGEHPNIPMYYKPANSDAANLADLMSMSLIESL